MTIDGAASNSFYYDGLIIDQKNKTFGTHDATVKVIELDLCNAPSMETLG